MPVAPHVLTVRISDAAMILGVFVTISALTGYSLGLGEANAVALRAEARALCGRAPDLSREEE